MIRHWTIYQGRPNSTDRSRPRVTLSRTKVFLLNKAAYEAMGAPAAVELRFDEGTRTIGLTPKDPRNQNAFPIKPKSGRSTKNYNYRVIHAAPFCRHFDIRPDSTVLFAEIDMDNEGTLLLEMNKAVKVGRGSR